MSLLSLQQDMHAWLVREDRDAAQRLGTGAAPGLRVYQNNYRAQLTACLEESFARTHAWIGDTAFHNAVVTHVDQVTPSSWTLDAYARDFPGTLKSLYPADPEVAELAWIDRALSEAFVACDVPTLSAGSLADVDWDRAILRFTPTLTIATLVTNATAIWSRLAAEEAPPAAERLPEEAAILVWRQEMTPRYRATDTQEVDLLLQARAGIPFADLCTKSVERLGEAKGIAYAGKSLGQWLAEGLITAIETCCSGNIENH